MKKITRKFAAILGLGFGTLGGAMASTVVCPVFSSGSISTSDGVNFTKNASSTRFGLDDGIVTNTTYRAFIWWDTSSIPAAAVIDDATLTFGFQTVTWLAGTREVRVGFVAQDYTAWNASSLSSQFVGLRADGSDGWLDQFFSSSSGGYSETTHFPTGYGGYSWLRSQRFGLSFKLASEVDTPVVEDTVLLNATAGSGITVTYYLSPSPTSPGNGGQVAQGASVSLSWSNVLPAGSRLRYRAQFSDRQDFSANVNPSNQLADTSWTWAFLEPAKGSIGGCESKTLWIKVTQLVGAR